jgi:hypothetical protein
MKSIMKNYLLVILTLLSFVGCNEDDVLPSPPTTVRGTVSSTIAITGSPITFTDNSTQVISRTWSFPGGTPESSTEAEVIVTFNEEGTYTCVLEVNFEGGITTAKDFVIEVSDAVILPGFANKDVFSFENETAALASWSSWSPEATPPATLIVDGSQGANGTSSSGKVSFTESGKEIQIFTNEDYSGINEKMDKTKKYEFSFWAKASAATTITAALENSVDINNHTWATANQEFKNYLWQDTDITTTWTKYTFDIDPSSQPYDIAENVYIKLKMVSSSIVDIWLDEFSLTEVVVTGAADGFDNKDIFSFENETAALASWKSWSPETTPPATLSVDASQGANGTSSSGKISFTAAGKEIQIFTNEDFSGINAKMDKTKMYEFSFWAKASAATTITAALENSVDINNHTWATANQEFKNYLWQDTDITTTWTKYTFNIDPSSQPYDIAENVYIKIKMSPSSIVDIWLDEFLLTEVTAVTDGFANRDIFSFESETAALASWKSWSPETTPPASLSVDASTGANGTSSSGKMTFTASGKEIQIFTNEDFSGINAKMDKTKMYEFSFWAKASAATTITAALENSVNTANHTWATANQEFKNYLWQDTDITTAWTKYTFDIDPSSQPYAIAENVYVKIKMAPSALVDIWLDEFSLKEK